MIKKNNIIISLYENKSIIDNHKKELLESNTLFNIDDY